MTTTLDLSKIPPGDPRHGKRYVYVTYRCRCRKCTDANTAYKHKSDAARLQRVLSGDPAVPHGSAGGYSNWGCRCQPCTTAATEYSKPYVKAYQQRQRTLNG